MGWNKGSGISKFHSCIFRWFVVVKNRQQSKSNGSGHKLTETTATCENNVFRHFVIHKRASIWQIYSRQDLKIQNEGVKNYNFWIRTKKKLLFNKLGQNAQVLWCCKLDILTFLHKVRNHSILVIDALHIVSQKAHYINGQQRNFLWRKFAKLLFIVVGTMVGLYFVRPFVKVRIGTRSDQSANFF